MDTPPDLNIVGVVRNGGPALSSTLDRINLLRERLSDSRVIIATNDNTDQTDQILAAFAEADDSVEILRLDGLSETCPDRVERIATARNAVLGRLFDSKPYHPFTLWLDLDGPNTALNPEEVVRAACRADVQWDGVFANSVPAYYDLYALRCEGWCDRDVWHFIDSKYPRRFLLRRKRRQKIREHVFDRQYSISPDHPLIPVKSAFSGLGLYRSHAIEGLQYFARRGDGRVVCEHVLLHEQMLAKGSKLYIDPGLTTIAPSEHLGKTSGAPFPERIMGSSEL